jgi:hypothetical protein
LPTETSTAPWSSPPQRAKKLRDRKAERQARKAEFWGRRLQEAAEDGPEALAAMQWDRARAALDRLPDQARKRAYEALAQVVDRVRETHAQ